MNHHKKSKADLKKREADLVFEEQLLNTLMEHIPDSIYFKNTKSHFIRVIRHGQTAAGFPTPKKW